MRDLVLEHLAHEEPVLFPALRSHVSADEWDAFSQRAVASTPPDIGYLLVGFFHEVATDGEVELILRHLPAEARAQLPAMRAEADALLRTLQAACVR